MHERYTKNELERYSQGDIVSGVKISFVKKTRDGDIEISESCYPYMIVATQDCDLEQDYNNRKNPSVTHDKFLTSILLLPAFGANNLREGNHFTERKWNMQRINSDRYKEVKQNNNKRYHYFTADENYQIPELVVDFKHYCTIPSENLVDQQKSSLYVASLAPLFRESFSQRLSEYMSRIALPETTLRA